MARGKKKASEAELIVGVDLGSKESEQVVIWKATRPLTVKEHEEISQKLRYEAEQTGLKIVLVPFSVDLTVGDQK
ncbi:hypothetical protein [Anaerosolibacter sp.]|uniref:hypothetical protein n=1 Tax=Anaerosolibacter sp. TaxID=1872527 RepID=UPI0039EE202C